MTVMRGSTAGVPFDRALALPAVCALAGLVIGLFTALAPGVTVFGGSALAIVVVIAVVAGIAPVLLPNPQMALGAFLIWLPFEDLVRKYLGNDIRIYFVKDMLFAMLLVAISVELRRDRSWRRALGEARVPLIMLMGWAVVRSFPSAFEDWRVAVVGLRLDFMYVPLVAIGFWIASSETRLRRTLILLTRLAVVVVGLGIIQVAAGGEFLAPSAPTPGLDNLVLERSLGDTRVLQPTGTFVDPGRFASMAIVAVVLTLVAYPVLSHRRGARVTALMGVGVAVAAIWATGGRGALLYGGLLVLVAIVANVRASGSSRQARQALGAAAICGCSVVAFALLVPSEFSARTSYYAGTLDPRAQTNEWSFRWNLYTDETLKGISEGGVLGQGTGTHALGLQYLFGGADRSLAGIYEVEAGHGVIAFEWGLIGVALWLTWSIGWGRRAIRAIREVRGSAYAPAAITLGAWLAIFLGVQFIAGKQAFQNYVSNAYFWLLSGVLFGLVQVARSRSKVTSNLTASAYLRADN